MQVAAGVKLASRQDQRAGGRFSAVLLLARARGGIGVIAAAGAAAGSPINGTAPHPAMIGHN
ncbi:MAG: hypothetical protein KJ947_16750 [Alphaproteobacteria bacterium]|nr:hypothetical protein [Alphaproteobacteria bacterium]MBU1551210.1 hypothetical protein [Alphaproteobacteria bacterium]MBU2334921.1 hypothetical protein [Alphaproteobacteria bacterium]MBU2388889.1 hypothetical protein [Alphaproteobacteria bacterium]